MPLRKGCKHEFVIYHGLRVEVIAVFWNELPAMNCVSQTRVLPKQKQKKKRVALDRKSVSIQKFQNKRQSLYFVTKYTYGYLHGESQQNHKQNVKNVPVFIPLQQ